MRIWDHIELQKEFSARFCKPEFLGFNTQDGRTFSESYSECLNADYETRKLNPRRAEQLLDKVKTILVKIRGAVDNGMDKKVKQVIDNFTRELRRARPEVRVELRDSKWSTEDASVVIHIPETVTEDEEDDILNMKAILSGSLYDSTEVYILAVTRTVEQPTA